MDYFYASNFAAGFNPGLWDNQLGAGFKPCSKVGLSLNYHYFATTAKVESAGKNTIRDWDRNLVFNWM